MKFIFAVLFCACINYGYSDMVSLIRGRCQIGMDYPVEMLGRVVVVAIVRDRNILCLSSGMMAHSWKKGIRCGCLRKRSFAS